MKITGLTTRLLKIDSAPRYREGVVPAGRPSHWYFPLVILHTDDGIDGDSMAYGPHADGRALADLLHESYLPQVLGLNPDLSEAIWQKLFARQRHLYNQTDSLVGVLDVAIWDIRGKAAGRSVAALRTPILAGETVRLTELPHFLTGRAMTIARGDVLIKGGITGLRKAMAACELFGFDLEIHTANTPLLDVANLQVACAARNTTMVEVHHPVFRFALKQHPFDVGPDGCAHLPTGPGLGVALDHDWIENHTDAIRRTRTP